MGKREYGCIMILFDINNWNQAVDHIIDENDIWNDDSGKFGKETEPHTTILYGLHDDEISLDDIKKFLPPIEDIEISVNGLSHFDVEHKDYDVVKLDLDSQILHEINGDMREKLPYTNNFPDYNPHMTLCYVKKGEGQKYKNDKLDLSFKPIKYKYGYTDGRDEFFTINTVNPDEDMGAI